LWFASELHRIQAMCCCTAETLPRPGSVTATHRNGPADGRTSARTSRRRLPP
jgi:hypothetical protein